MQVMNKDKFLQMNYVNALNVDRKQSNCEKVK